MDVANSLYYTLSTIAQVLAGFLSLSSIFLLFRIQFFMQMQTEMVRAFVKELNSELKYGDYPPGSKWYSLAKEMDGVLYRSIIIRAQEVLFHFLYESDINYTISNANILDKTNELYSVFHIFEKSKLMMVMLARLSIISGLITILFAIITLANIHQPFIIVHATLIFIISISGMSVSLFIMTFSILLSINDKSRKGGILNKIGSKFYSITRA